MTRHDDPDTTTPIDTTTGQAPVVSTPAELDALPVDSVVVDRGGTPRTKRYRDSYLPGGWTHAGRSPLSSQQLADGHAVTLVYVPGRDLLAEAEARGVERARVDLAAQVAQAEATLIAEAEARGVARGRGEALTEAAEIAAQAERVGHDEAETRGFAQAADAISAALRARAAETPGGAA